jgi:hypothetical protein
LIDCERFCAVTTTSGSRSASSLLSAAITGMAASVVKHVAAKEATHVSNDRIIFDCIVDSP